MSGQVDGTLRVIPIAEGISYVLLRALQDDVPENDLRGAAPGRALGIGSAPDCAKNRAYLPKQKEAFLAGKSPPDFAPMNFEIDFKGRATEKDLTPLGRKQMGF